MTDTFLILDFDSTIIEVEALDELAALALSGQPDGQKIVEEIAHITNLGMEGKLPVEESLEIRLKLLKSGKEHIDQLLPMIKQKISPSFRANKDFLERHRDRTYVISNGFKEIIIPVIEELSLKPENVCANTFLFDAEDQIIGFDKSNLLAGPNGKSKQLRALDLNGDIFVIGDGMTDFQMTDTGLVTKFIAYTGNVHREMVAEKADHIVEGLDTFIDLNLMR